MTAKIIEKAAKDAEYFANKYDVPRSAVVWLGGCRFIVVKNGKQIRIGG